MAFFTFTIHTLLFLFLFCFPFFSGANCGVQTDAIVGSSQHFVPFPKTSHFKYGFQRILLSVALGVVTGLTAAFLSVLFIRSLLDYLNRTPLLEGPLIFCPKIDAHALQSALLNQTQLLGSSSSPNGKCYRAILANGFTVTVKRLEPIQCGRRETRRRMQQQMAVLGGLKHRNVMSLRAYVSEIGSCCLVYDFVATGSLEDAMRKVRENQLELKWEVRLRIAVGIARGLQFLHFECNPRILHCNLKPSNVLLDAEFEPRLADFGLTNLIPDFHTPASLYTAPECLNNSRFTDKSDIYSFGVILRVLLTGRDPSETEQASSDRGDGSGSGSGGSLGRWLEQSVEPREVLDKSIRGEGMEEEEEEMVLALRIAGVCTSELAEDRPCSDELLVMLTQLQSF
ncbi:inactive leucine-rich repeat receptor-like protein kinase CORYNE [Benincasa hispida]|uniref:inactive leucine-rich repeat receptor-like protein kinase CORYNE n=1 Tax=Benincasa hispida TaxID=102211 RepID=UPI0018FF4B77|nr:inactive leucine-rich repeat receptor-like protein kinase CORYNE [Benincasa hispida]